MDLQRQARTSMAAVTSWGSGRPLTSVGAAMQAMIYSGMNGIGLALVVPCVQSLIADYTLAERRGAAFGVLYFTGAIGEQPIPTCLSIWGVSCTELRASDWRLQLAEKQGAMPLAHNVLPHSLRGLRVQSFAAVHPLVQHLPAVRNICGRCTETRLQAGS